MARDRARVFALFVGVALLCCLPWGREAGAEEVTFRDETVEVRAVRAAELFEGKPVIMVTLTNHSAHRLEQVSVEIHFFDARGQRSAVATIPLFAFTGNVAQATYAAPEFSRMQIAAVRYRQSP